MAEPIAVEIIGRVAGLRRALESATALMRRFEENASSSAARGSNARVKGAQQEAAAVAKAHNKAAQERTKVALRLIENASKETLKIAVESAKSEIREKAWAEREKTRATERGERDRRAAAERARKEAKQDAAKAERERTQDAKREQRERDRIQTNSARLAGRLAERGARREERAQRSNYRQREQFAQKWTGIAGGSVRSIIGGATRLAGTALALGGGFSIADAAQSYYGAERAATALSNSAYTAEKGSTRPDAGAILGRAREVQAATGIDKTELIKGWQSYVAKSSDFRGGRENLGDLAKLAKGSGSDFGSVMSAAGWLRAQNANMSPEEMMSTMRNIVGQGKLGAVEISDLAQIAGKVTASSAMYADTRSDADAKAGISSQTVAQRRLLGLSQIAIKTAGNPEEAATAVTRFGADVLAHGKGLKEAGLNVADAKTGLLADPAEILAQMFEKTGGHLGKLHKLGLGERSIKVAEALAPVYQSAAAMATGNDADKRKAGADAVRREVNRYTSAGYSSQDVDKDFQAVMQTSAEKLDLAVKAIGETLQTKLQPYLSRLADQLPQLMPKIERLMDGMARLADFLVNNPLKGIGGVVLAKVVADLGMAAIGAGVKKALVALVAGAAPAGGGSGAGGVGNAGGGAAAAGGAAIGAAAAFVGWEGYKLLEAKDAGEERGKSHVGDLIEQAKKASTPEELAAVQKEFASAKKRGGGMGIVRALVSANSMGINTIGSLVTGNKNESLSDIEKYGHAKKIVDNAESIANALEEARKRIKHSNDDLKELPQGAFQMDLSREYPMAHPRRGGAA